MVRGGAPHVLALLTLFGCGGGGGSVSLDQLATEHAAVFCGRAFSCCTAAELGGDPSLGEADCRALYESQFGVEFGNFKTGVDAGRTRYHGDRARRCLDTLASLPCSLWGVGEELRRFPDCTLTFEGLVAPGGACDFDQECANGYCELNGRTCVERLKLGEPCTVARCEQELICLYDGSGSAACAAPLADGSACYSNTSCANLCDLNVCGPSTFCDGI
jgi:hypothetical protein